MKELLETKFSLYNKYIAKELWTLAAVMLWELVSEYDYYRRVNKLLPDGSFYSSINNIFEATWLKRKNQEAAIKVLEDAWILTKIFNKDDGNKRYFKLDPYKIAEYTKYEWEIDTPMSWENTPYVLWGHTLCPEGHTLCPESTYPMSSEDIAMSWEYNHKQLIKQQTKTTNKNNIIGKQKNFSNADASPTSEVDVKTELVDETPKPKRKTKKQQRYEEVVTSTEFNTLLHEWLDEKDFPEIDTLRWEYVELRCSKDYRAFTDWAIKRNLKVLTWTSLEERKAIIEKSVVKWRTWLFPLNDYDKKHLEEKEVNVEWSDARLYKKIFDTKCKEKEDELPEWTTHNLLMDLVQKYWEERVRTIYYDKVRPQILSIYWIKRDWVK